MKGKQVTLEQIIDEVESIKSHALNEKYTLWAINKETGEITRFNNVEDLEELEMNQPAPLMNIQYTYCNTKNK